MLLAPDNPETVAGIVDAVVFPVPNWPDEFEPQHLAVPSVMVTHVWLSPAETAEAPEAMFRGPTGVVVDDVLAFPSCPELLRPQQRTPPVVNTAQE
jgi:hypothetical protein